MSTVNQYVLANLPKNNVTHLLAILYFSIKTGLESTSKTFLSKSVDVSICASYDIKNLRARGSMVG
jgi:hypothetical protein